MPRRKKIKIGDIFKFAVPNDVEEYLSQEDLHRNGIANICNELRETEGYFVVINIDEDGLPFVAIKKVDKNNPSLEEINSSKTIKVMWIFDFVVYEEGFERMGNLKIEPVIINTFWRVRDSEFNDFYNGKEVEILIKKQDGGFHAAVTIGSTFDVNIIKELYKSPSLNYSGALIASYILNYSRNENDINTLKF